MKFTMQYSVGGGVADVPQDDIKEFNELARQNGETPEPVFSYRIKDGSGTHDVEVPKSQYGEFEKLATENGAKIEPLRRFTTNDGKEWLLGMEEMHSFFNDPTSPYFKERPLIDPVGDPSSYPESSGKGQPSQEELEKALEANARLEAERSAAPGQAPQAPAQRADYPVDYDSTDQFAEYHRKKGEEDSRRITHVAGEIMRGMFTTEGMREVAEEHVSVRPLAYISDLCNSFVAGLLGGFAKISEGAGALVQSVGETTGSDVVKDFGKWTREGAQADQRMLQENLRTDTLDTKGGGAVSKVLDVGKGVAGVTGEFLPAAIPGAGQAYAATLVSAGSVNRYANVFDEAIYNGVDPKTAEGLAFAGAGIDALGNMLLMGKFRGIWSGEQKALADAAKRGVVRRIVGETVKTGAIMSGMGMGGEIIDEGAQGAQDPDWSKVAKVGFDQFIEGGLFHLVNSGAHSATHIGWGRDAKGIPSGAARDMLANPEGRALIFCNSPEAAAEIFRARRKGENVSRKMIRDLGISEDVATTVADRNAIGDRLMADYDAFKARVRTRMDDVQAVALSNEIAFRMKGGYEDPAYEEVWTKAVEQIKDAREIDDPERRAQIVSEAMKEVLSESQKTSPNEGGDEPAPGNQTGVEPPKKPNPPESRESKPVEPSAGPGTGDGTPEAPKPPEGGESRSVTSVRVGDVKPGESFTYEGNELYKNEKGEIVEVDVGKDGKRVERPTKRRFTGDELVDIPDQAKSADVNPVADVPEDAARQHLTPEGDLKSGVDVSVVKQGDTLTVGKSKFTVVERNDDAGTIKVSDETGAIYEVNENGEVREARNGRSGEGGGVEGARAGVQQDAQGQAAEGDRKAGADRDQGRADGREAQGEGGGADKGAVAVDRTGVPDWLDDEGVAEIFKAGNFNDGWGSAVSAFFRHRVRTDEKLAELRRQFAAETDEAKRKKLNNQYKKRVNELWEQQGTVQPQDEMRDAINAIQKREGSAARANRQAQGPDGKHMTDAARKRASDVKELTGSDFDETSLSDKELMRFRKLYQDYSKGGDEAKVSAAAEALKKLVAEHEQKIKDLSVESTKAVRVKDGAANAKRFNEGDKVSFIEELATMARRRNVSRVDATIAITPTKQRPDKVMVSDGKQRWVVDADLLKTPEEMDAFLAGRKNAAEGPKPEVTAETPAEAPAKPAEASAPEAAPAGEAPKKDLKTAVRELEKLRDRRASLKGTQFTGEDAQKNREENEMSIAELDRRIEAAEAGLDDLREPSKPIPPAENLKPNPKKAAKVVADFASKDDTRKTLKAPYHDKKNGVVVATDGRILIATKHGFDPNAKEPEEGYPNWTHVVPDEKNLTVSIKVNPAELQKVCKDAIRLSRAVGIKDDGQHNTTPNVVLRHGDGTYTILSAEYLLTVAKAMEANGLTELRAAPTKKGTIGHTPLMARNADTTILIMPLRGGSYESVGRVSSNLVFDGMTGRIIRAPERTDMGVMRDTKMSEEWLTTLRESVARERKRAEAEARNLEIFEVITGAWKNGEKDPRVAYKRFNSETDFDSLTPENQKAFADLLNAGSEEELARQIAEYVARRMPDAAANLWVDKDPKQIAKIEKRIAAEDEVESRLMRDDEARALFGLEPRKKAAKDASANDAEEGERLKKESDEAEANIEKVNTEVGDLISKHLLAQGTAKNNAAGREMKAKAKSALVDRLSSLTDEEFDSVKQSFKQTMRDNGEDMDRVGEIQAIFNAETAKRNAKSGKPAAKPKAEEPAKPVEEMPAPAEDKRTLRELAEESVSMLRDEKFDEHEAVRGAFREKMKTATDAELKELHAEMKKKADKSSGEEKLRYTGIASELNHEINSRFAGNGKGKKPNESGEEKIIGQTRDGESVRIVQNGRVYEVELPDVKFPKTFTRATSKADWEAKMKEMGELQRELKAKAPFHSVINPKTGKYYANDSEIARRRQREIAAYNEAVQRAANQAMEQIGEYDESWDSVKRSPRAQETQEAWDEGKQNLSSSPNTKVVKSGKSQSDSIVYSPPDGTTPFRVNKKSISHGIRGVDPSDNVTVGRHIGEALDASQELPEHTADARYRMAAVKIGGADAHVLFTIEKRSGTVTQIDVLKSLNTKRAAQKGSTLTSTNSGMGARPFETAKESIAELESAWKSQFRDGIEAHNKARGRDATFIRDGEPAKTPAMSEATRKELAKVRTELDGESGDNVVPEWMDKLTDAEAKEYIDLIKKAHADPSMDDARIDWEVKKQAEIEQREAGEPERLKVKGRPHALSTMHGNGNSSSLDTIKNRAEKGVLPDSITEMPEGIGISRPGRFGAKDPAVLFHYAEDGDSIGHPLFGDTKEIMSWVREQGLDRKSVKVTQEDSAGSTEKPVREGGKDETRPVPTRHDSGRYSESRPEGSVPQAGSAGKPARKSRATAAVEEVANALTAKDFDAGKQAMERLRKSIDDGEAFPDKETVAKLAENVPPELRKSFVDNMDKWREHAESSDEAPDAEDAGRSEVLDRASKGVRPTGFHEADDGVHFEYGDKDVVVDGDAEDVLKWARDKKVFKAEVDAEKKAAAEAFNAEAFEIGSDGKKKPIARGTKETMDAYRRLGITAGLPDADLRKELRRCEAHSSDPRFAQRAKDIKAVLEYRKATENLPPKEGGSYAGTTDDDIREMAVLDVTGKKVAFLDNVADMANVHWNDPESIKQYLLGHIGERFSTIATGEAIELGDELPDEYSRSNSAEAERRNIKRLAKARAKLATGLGDAIQSAEAFTAEPARDKEREGGVYYRRPVTFALRGGDGQIKVYDADLLTYKVNGVEQLYDAVHLRDNTTPGIAGAVEQTVSNVRPSRTTEASALPSHNAVSARESIPQSSAGGKPKSDMAVAYEATKALSNFIPGVKVVVEKDGAKPDSSATPIRSKAGTVVGTWNRKTKTLTLKRGATLETVAHELGGHALWQYAEQHPELGLKATLEAWANDAPPELVDAIKKAYPNITGEKLMEEIFAHRFGMEKSGKIAEALKTREGRKWYQKVWDSIKGAWRSMAARLGGNRIDLNAIEDMTPDEAVDFIADQLVRGKTLGKLNMSRPEDVEVEREMRRVNPAPTDLMRGSRWTRDWYMRNMADRFHDVLSLERDLIAASGVGIDAKDSAYHALRVSSGRKEAKRREIQHIYDRVEKLFNDNRGNITSEDVHKFLLAQAAPERNAKILRRSNGAKTEGAGMSDADAAQIMADLTTAGKLPVLQEFEAIRKELSDRYGVDYLADNGIIDRKTADRLKAEEPHYVPMRDDYTDENGFDLNSSRRLELPPLKTAHGRSDMADHPLAFLFMQAADNVARVEANIVRQKLARIVQRNNSLGVGRVRGQRIVPDYDVATGNTAMVIDKLDTERENPNIIVFRENGKKKVIEFNGPRGALIVQAVRGEGINRGPEFLQKMSRMWAATATQYSPLGFKTNNAIKDSTEVLMNISEDEGVGTGAKFLALRASAVANGYASTMRDYIRTGNFSGRKGTRLREFVENGGLIGGGVREGYQELEQRFEDAAKVISRIDRAKNKPLAMLEAMRDKISFSNEMTENLSRFINYDVRRSAGESIEEAIIASREDSTDFNMYGNKRWINNVRVFSNSILGGTMRATRQMAKHPIKTAEILISLGIIEELADAAINYDDDEREQEGLGTGDDISEYERSQTMRLRVGGKYARVPFHLGPFSLLKYVGNNAGRAILGKIGWAEAMENVAKEAATVGSHFSGWGEVSVGEEGPSFMNSASPTLGQPFVQVKLNENFMGGQIRKEHNFPGMKDLPDSSFSKPQTGEGWEQFAKLVNRLGGGDEFRKAYFTWLDNAPEDYKYAFEQVFKNTGKDVLQTWDTSKRAVESVATGENKMVLNDVPVVNKVFRSVPQNDSRYYRSLHAYSKAMQEWGKTPKTSRMREIESEIPGIGCLDGLAANITAMRKRELETTDEREKESLAAQRRKEQAKFIRIMSGKDRSHDADFRRQRIVKAADELTKHEVGRLGKEEKAKLMRILEGVPYDEIRSALEAYYSEDVEVKGSDGYETRQRLKDKTIDKRIERLQMLLQD